MIASLKIKHSLPMNSASSAFSPCCQNVSDEYRDTDWLNGTRIQNNIQPPNDNQLNLILSDGRIPNTEAKNYPGSINRKAAPRQLNTHITDSTV